MDIKIRFTKTRIAFLLALIVCGIIGGIGYNCSAYKARQEIKSTCQENCGCFDNVTDYRLTDEQARLFAKFMKALQKRRDASVLEFMDTVDAIRIQKAFAICQPQEVPPPPPAQQNKQQNLGKKQR